MRVVIDTSVIVAGLRSQDGASYLLIEAVLDRRLDMVLSEALFLEYEEVLKRSEHSVELSLGAGTIDIFLTELSALVKPVEIHFQWRPQLRDADDEMVLESAINGSADAIVTFNLSDFSEVKKQFGVAVVTPGELLRRIRT